MAKKLVGDALKMHQMATGPLGPLAGLLKDSHPELFEELHALQLRYEGPSQTVWVTGPDDRPPPPPPPSTETLAWRAAVDLRSKQRRRIEYIENELMVLPDYGCGPRIMAEERRLRDELAALLKALEE